MSEGMSEERAGVPPVNTVSGGKRSSAKAIAIWALLFIMIGVIHAIGRSIGGVAPIVLPAIPIAIMLVIWVVNTIRFTREIHRFHADSNAGVVALARGDLSRAHDIYWGWAERARMPRVSALARHNLAWTLMRQGKLAQAIAVATNNRADNPDALKAIGFASLTTLDLALFQALLGDLDAAAQSLAAAEQCATQHDYVTVPAMTTYARAVLHCRAGRSDEAARLLDDHWAECEALFTGDTLRPLRVVRAFAVAAGGPRSAGLAEALLASARPIHAGEYDFLGAAWPEMAAFLVTHQLTR